MYRIIQDKAKELKDGRTNKYISEIMGMNKCYITSILKGNKACSKIVAMVLINIKTNIQIGTNTMEIELNKYFHKED